MTKRGVSKWPGVTGLQPGTYTPPTPPTPLSSFYGVNGHFTWSWSPNATPYFKANWNTAVAKMKDLRMGIYRNGYSCYFDSNVNFTGSDGSVFADFINNYAEPNGIEVAPVLLPDYKRVPSGGTPTETSAYNIGFTHGRDAATWLQGKVPWYEVGNELDANCIIDGSHRGNVTSDYINSEFILCRGAVLGLIDGIKSLDTTTPIMCPGGAWLHTAFFDMLLNGTQPDGSGGYRQANWDLTSWHWYVNNFPGNDDIENPTSQGGYNVLAHLATWGKPIYITECGAVSSAYSDNETNIAAAITGSYLMQRFYSVRNTYNIKHVSLYQLFDAAAPGVPSSNNEMKFGLVQNDGTTNKARYASVKTFINTNYLS